MYGFLVLMESIIISIYLRTTDRHFCDKGNVRDPTSLLLKRTLIQTLDTFRTFSCWEDISCFKFKIGLLPMNILFLWNVHKVN